MAHLHYFSKETALADLEDAGYEVLDYFYHPAFGRAWFGARPAASETPEETVVHHPQRSRCRLLGGFSLLVLAR